MTTRPTGGTPSSASPQMEEEVYGILNAGYETYWRYLTRHELLHHLWADHRGRPRGGDGIYRVLDVGCGPGGFLASLMKRERIRPFGIDLFLPALQYCRRRGVTALAAAEAARLPFAAGTFDFVCSSDVLLYMDDDAEMLREMHRVCAPGGTCLVCVAANRSVWSARDVRMNHRRRYTLAELSEKFEVVGLQPVRQTYTDSWLLPILWLMVKFATKDENGLAELGIDNAGDWPLVNAILRVVSRAEAVVARRARIPFGVSAVVLARKPA